MTTSNHPAELPPVLTQTGETNRHIARIKASLAKRWSVNRMNELFDAVKLAWCLLALERTGDAQELASAVATTMCGHQSDWGFAYKHVWHEPLVIPDMESGNG